MLKRGFVAFIIPKAPKALSPKDAFLLVIKPIELLKPPINVLPAVPNRPGTALTSPAASLPTPTPISVISPKPCATESEAPKAEAPVVTAPPTKYFFFLILFTIINIT